MPNRSADLKLDFAVLSPPSFPPHFCCPLEQPVTSCCIHVPNTPLSCSQLSGSISVNCMQHLQTSLKHNAVRYPGYCRVDCLLYVLSIWYTVSPFSMKMPRPLQPSMPEEEMNSLWVISYQNLIFFGNMK